MGIRRVILCLRWGVVAGRSCEVGVGSPGRWFVGGGFVVCFAIFGEMCTGIILVENPDNTVVLYRPYASVAVAGLVEQLILSS